MKFRVIYKLFLFGLIFGATSNLFGMEKAASLVLTQVYPFSTYLRYYRLISFIYNNIFQYGVTKLLISGNSKNSLNPQANYIEQVYENALGINTNRPAITEMFGGLPATYVLEEQDIIEIQAHAPTESKLTEIRGIFNECQKIGFEGGGFIYEKILSLNDLCIEGNQFLDKVFQKAKHEIQKILYNSNGEFKGFPRNKESEIIKQIIAQFEKDIQECAAFGKMSYFDPKYVSELYNHKFAKKIKNNSFNQDLFKVIALCKKGDFQQAEAIVQKYYEFSLHKEYDKKTGTWKTYTQSDGLTKRHEIIKNVFDKRFSMAKKLAQQEALRQKVSILIADITTILNNQICSPAQREDATGLLGVVGNLFEETLKGSTKAEKELSSMLATIDRIKLPMQKTIQGKNQVVGTQTVHHAATTTVDASTQTDLLDASVLEQQSVDFIVTTKESCADLKFDQKILDELIADQTLAQELREAVREGIEKQKQLNPAEQLHDTQDGKSSAHVNMQEEVDTLVIEYINDKQMQLSKNNESGENTLEIAKLEVFKKFFELNKTAQHLIEHPIDSAIHLAVDTANVLNQIGRLAQLTDPLIAVVAPDKALDTIKDLAGATHAIAKLPSDEKVKLAISGIFDFVAYGKLFHVVGKTVGSLTQTVKRLEILETLESAGLSPKYLEEIKKIRQFLKFELDKVNKIERTLGKSVSAEIVTEQVTPKAIAVTPEGITVQPSTAEKGSKYVYDFMEGVGEKARTGRVSIKVYNMNEFFKNFEFGKLLKKNSTKLGQRYKGQTIYRLEKNVNKFMQKGHHFYLDSLHFDHIEVLDKQGMFSHVVNFDGSLNLEKTDSALLQARKKLNNL